jgi:histone acetyltransferase 1
MELTAMECLLYVRTDYTFEEAQSLTMNWRRYEVSSENQPAPYSFIGYATAYRYFFYDTHHTSPAHSSFKPKAAYNFSLPFDTAPSLPARERISQFLILPPYQRRGHGRKIYEALYRLFHSDPLVTEITVEDPNESFDDMRDYCDYHHLDSQNAFSAININTSIQLVRKGVFNGSIVDEIVLESIRKQYKIAPRQFIRIVEMNLLHRIPHEVRFAATSATAAKNFTDKLSSPEKKTQFKQYQLWQIWVKTRIYRRNLDQLMQLERAERIERLDATLKDLELDYGRILQIIKGEKRSVVVGKGKRKIVDDDEEEELEDGDVEVDDEEDDERPTKRTRTAEPE